MSGPIDPRDAGLTDEPCLSIETRQGRAAAVGGLDIIRVLPTKGRRTVGPWCFVDLMRPPDVEDPDPMEVGPHPHVGLATVTWLFSGEAEHSDSLGTTQLIRPGELNLMSAGQGIAHAEEGLGPRLMGAQMWLAQPDRTRHGESGFEHHDDLPRLDLGTGDATVLLGTLGGVASPARQDWATVGADLRLRRGRVDVGVDASHEHAVIPIDAPVRVGDAIVEPGWLALVPAGLESFPIDVRGDSAIALLIGGAPLGEQIFMWWNFVARTKEEVTEAWQAWDAGDTDRFGPVPSGLAPMRAPRPPWLPPE
jgi:redox-sensitive bicupin YhaK (pirin superfamily)